MKIIGNRHSDSPFVDDQGAKLKAAGKVYNTGDYHYFNVAVNETTWPFNMASYQSYLYTSVQSLDDHISHKTVQKSKVIANTI